MTNVFPGVEVPRGHWGFKNNPAHAKKYLNERCPLGRFGKG